MPDMGGFDLTVPLHRSCGWIEATRLACGEGACLVHIRVKARCDLVGLGDADRLPVTPLARDVARARDHVRVLVLIGAPWSHQVAHEPAGVASGDDVGNHRRTPSRRALISSIVSATLDTTDAKSSGTSCTVFAWCAI